MFSQTLSMCPDSKHPRPKIRPVFRTPASSSVAEMLRLFPQVGSKHTFELFASCSAGPHSIGSLVVLGHSRDKRTAPWRRWNLPVENVGEGIHVTV